MKKLLPIFILFFNVSVFCQIIATTEDGETVILKKNKTWEYAVKNRDQADLTYGWSLLAESRKEPQGVDFYYQPRKVKTDALGRKETWLRVIPKFPAAYMKQNKLPIGTAYIQQYLTLNCEDERYNLESATLYDKKGEIIQTKKFWGTAFYDKVIPGTVGESFIAKLCR